MQLCYLFVFLLETYPTCFEMVVCMMDIDGLSVLPQNCLVIPELTTCALPDWFRIRPLAAGGLYAEWLTLLLSDVHSTEGSDQFRFI